MKINEKIPISTMKFTELLKSSKEHTSSGISICIMSFGIKPRFLESIIFFYLNSNGRLNFSMQESRRTSQSCKHSTTKFPQEDN